MEQKHRNVLQTSFAYLIKNLHNVEEVCDHLVSDDILTSGMMDSIKHKKPRPSGQTRELLSILPRRGTKAYNSFINALEASTNEEVADYLRVKDGSKGTGKNAQNTGKPDDDSKKPNDENEDVQKTSTQHSENPDKKNKLESANSNQGYEDWPDLKNRLKMLKKSDIPICTKESFTKICESKQVYHMTGSKKGKCLIISNVPCNKPNTDTKSPDDTQSKETIDPQSKEIDNPQSKGTNDPQSKDTHAPQSTKTDDLQPNETDDSQSKEKDNLQSDGTQNAQPVANDCSTKCRSCVDFDKTSILQLFKHMQYESKGADAVMDVSGDNMKTFLQDHLNNKENSVFDSLVIVIFSGGDKYKPGKIYDKDGNEIENTEIFSMIQESTAFAGKPKIVIIRTYNFEEETETYDVLDAEKQELHFCDKGPNNKDLFVVSSQPRTKKGPWIIGDEMNGSYFMQALIHVFKKMAHEKSFLEMMKEVNDCLITAMVPVNGTSAVKEHVAEVMILEHSIEKELFFFPGLIDVPMKVRGWPDLAAGRNTVRKKDIKLSSFEFYGNILKDRKIYQMTNATNRGKFILISNAQCIQCTENTDDEEEKKKKYLNCLANTDFDKSNMSQLLKSMGYELKGGDQVKNLKKEEITEFLKRKVNEIDKDQSAKYDSLVILFLSGKYECDAGKIYDCDGKLVQRSEILEIIKGCQYFKGKPKVVFVQTYNFQDESQDFDSTDSANDILKDCEPNKDDIFVVSNYPRIVQGPWILGEDMSGSYFIQALIHVFTKFACEKSFIELLKELLL
ncbi:uncharacterized protein LOC127720207 isoform X2 [Mytilus californianus]|uniref:uncharacterized protein LOC127720207 isoform X2 n=1 Tax=Mytilus californianus TaxID=6549 RepID=UPI0022464A71|nr:uncharacterized protein LOC127720207 isoform X2 [Mytilus californianus]